MTVHSPPADELLREPPPPTSRVLAVGLIGLSLVSAALIAGLVNGAPRRGFEAHSVDGLRALLSIVGLTVVGCAVSLRPTWYVGWLGIAAAGLLGYGFGPPPPTGTEWMTAPPRSWIAAVPNSWDSIQTFFGVACLIGIVGAIFTRSSRNVVYGLVLAGMCYHFGGIFSAILSPSPTPMIVDHYWKRVARPYVQFAYFNNAYQFYSPDPGPASELWACIEYKTANPGEIEDIDAPKETEWAYIPRRRTHYVDPLGLNFYRHLSITENVAQFQGPPLVSDGENDMVRRRRQAVTNVPRVNMPDYIERQVPSETVVAQILPSYARHLAHAYSRNGKEVKSVKLYRVRHHIPTTAKFYGFEPTVNRKVSDGMSIYNPSLYEPFFQGEFDPSGRLINPTEPLLYWHVPILQVRTPPVHRHGYRDQGFDHYFHDYVSVHAGAPRNKE